MGKKKSFRPKVAEGLQVFEAGLTVAGTRHRKALAQRFVRRSEQELTFDREPGNPADPNAIRVLGVSAAMSGVKEHFVGYVPRAVAKRIVEGGFWGLMRPLLRSAAIEEDGQVTISFDLAGPIGRKLEYLGQARDLATDPTKRPEYRRFGGGRPVVPTEEQKSMWNTWLEANSHAELARLLGRPPSTVRRWHREEWIPEPFVEAVLGIVGWTDQTLAYGNRAGIIENTPELREQIRKAMAHRRLKMPDLVRAVGLGNPDLLHDLLGGGLDWWPPTLSAVLAAAGISREEAKVTKEQRALLSPAVCYEARAMRIPRFKLAALQGAVTKDEIWSLNCYTQVVPIERAALFVVDVDNEEMYPALRPGDRLFCARGPIEDGDMVVARIDECIVCRRFWRLGNAMSWHPLVADVCDPISSPPSKLQWMFPVLYQERPTRQEKRPQEESEE